MENPVYVPSSRSNIIPPQTIIYNLKTKDDLDVGYSKHNDTKYIISFKKKHFQLPYCSLTILIGSNGIFHLRIGPGYTSFCERASNFQCY